MKDLCLAVDFGTSRLKAALIDENKTHLALEVCASPVCAPFAGASEMDMDAAWEAFCAVTRALLAQEPSYAQRIAGVGVAGLGEGLWAVGGDGAALRPAILWNDSRMRDMDIPNLAESRKLLTAESATPLFPAAPPVLLRWLRDNEPDNYRRIRWSARGKDWINFKLTGIMATDYSDASTSALNVRSRRYIPEIYDMLGVPEGADTLPPLHASSDIIGEVTADASARTGIPKGTPVVAGAIDAAAILFGAGASAVGDGCIVFGTCLANETIIGEKDVNHADDRGSFLLPVSPEGFIRMLGTNNGNGTISWVRRTLTALDHTGGDALAETAPAGCGGVMFLPYLSGERAPFKDPYATGSFFGLTARTTAADMLRSAYEGVAYSIMDCHRALPPVTGRLMAVGGGAKCDLLCRLAASGLGREVLRPRSRQPGLDAMAAAVRLGLGQLSPADCLPPCDSFPPDEALRCVLLEGFARFLALRTDMAPHWH